MTLTLSQTTVEAARPWTRVQRVASQPAQHRTRQWSGWLLNRRSPIASPTPFMTTSSHTFHTTWFIVFFCRIWWFALSEHVKFNCVAAVKATVLDGEPIVGLTVMKQLLYVLRQQSSEVEVYCAETFKLQRRELVSRGVTQVTCLSFVPARYELIPARKRFQNHIPSLSRRRSGTAVHLLAPVLCKCRSFDLIFYQPFISRLYLVCLLL